MSKYNNSKEIYNQAIKIIPGGVNSPVRAFKSVGSTPIFIKKANGSKIFDEDGNEYIDYISSWGPLILGHNNPVVLKAVKEVISNGSSYGLPTKLEVELAKLIIECIPSIEKIRLTTSGTEAAMAAIRLSRAYTGRKKIIKFEGCYHGHSDALLVKAGSGSLTSGNLDSNGITKSVTDNTVIIPYNDISSLKKAFLENKDQIASVIIEPIAANMGIIVPGKDFIVTLRNLCNENNSLLIFDEVITGFRIGIDGAQGYFNVKPDLTILGKIIGGGYPIGAFGGKKDIMDMIAPDGNVYHAGTLSGNPVSVAAGIATIKFLKENPDIYITLKQKCNYLKDGINRIINKIGIKAQVCNIASLLTLFFTDHSLRNMNDVMLSDTKVFSKYFNYMLDKGIVIPPSQYEAYFISTTHTQEDLDKTLDVIERAIIECKN
jgi:glutamate-1-semialdehyde 2,1-aminomutase